MITTTTNYRELIDLSPPEESFYDDLREGLKQSPPDVPCKYLYDQRGSFLFDRICELDSYYATRTEKSIMRDHTEEIVECLGTDVLLIEYGSGNSLKTRILLDNLKQPAGYVPIDISRDHLLTASRSISEDYPELLVQPIFADYTQSISVPDEMPGKRVIYFPGSTIGNFNQREAIEMMRRFVKTLGEDGSVLIGIDLKKDVDVLHKAYNDERGITAAFNKNILHRMADELDADVDTKAFAHRAPYFPEEGYVEMRLVCRAQHTIQLNGESFSFKPGDYIRTERSHKYSISEFADLAQQAGLKLQEVWTDDRDYFSVQYYSVSN